MALFNTVPSPFFLSLESVESPILATVLCLAKNLLYHYIGSRQGKKSELLSTIQLIRIITEHSFVWNVKQYPYADV